MKRALSSGSTRLFVLVSLAVLSFLAQESLSRGGLAEGLAWGLASPHLVLANLVLIGTVMVLVSALIGRVMPGTLIAFVLLLLFSVVNHGKLMRLQQPLFPWDFWYAKQVVALLPALSKPEVMTAYVEPVSAAVLMLLWALVRQERRIGPRRRIAMLLAALGVLGSVVFHRALPWSFPALLATENEVWDQKWNYERNGFLLAFAMNAQPILVDAPEDYCETTVREFLEDVIPQRVAPVPDSLGQPISLVLFVSESFHDLMHIPYEAEEDPLQNFRSLRSRFPAFRMISPSFGGNTSHVEIEMLTGLSNAFFPPSAVPYDHYVKRALPSIPGVLKEAGYRTIAIHPYHDWFWNRRNAFPLLGFEELIFLREFRGAAQRGWFISDEALVDKIMERIDRMGESPFFVYALSMQNHGEYDPNRYAPDEVDLRSELPANLMSALKTYATGLRDADRELARLLRYLEGRSEPVLALFCGDHLPSFGPDYAVYRESGAIESEPGTLTLEEAFEMASVPCLLWANREDLLHGLDVPEHLSPIYFPPLLLERLGIRMPGPFRYLSEGMLEYPVVHRQFLQRSDGHLLDFTSEAESDRFVQGLQMLQYDVLFGERYSIDGPGALHHAQTGCRGGAS